MKGFVSRHQQALAIGASGAVLLIVAASLTAIILAGRSTATPTAGRPTPSPTFDLSGPTLSPSQSASPSGTGSPSPGASASATASAGGGPSSTPIGFTNGGVGCPPGLANCTPPPRTSASAAAVPVPKVSFAGLTVPGGPTVAAALSADHQTVWFTEGSANKIGAVSAASPTPKEFSLSTNSDPNPVPLGMTIDPGGNLWVIEKGNGTSGSVVEIPSASLSAALAASNQTQADSAITASNRSHPLPSGSFLDVKPGQPVEGIAVDGNSNVWFSQASGTSNGPTVGHLSTQAADGVAPEQCALPPAAGRPTSITVSGGKVFLGTDTGLGVFTKGDCTKVSTQFNGTYSQHAPASPAGCQTSSAIQSVTVDAAGTVWFGTSAGVGKVVNGTTPYITACNTGSGMAGSHLGLVSGPDPSQGSGRTALWASFQGSGAGLDRVLSSTGSPFPFSGASGDDLRAVVVDSAGNLWVTDATSNKILKASVSG